MRALLNESTLVIPLSAGGEPYLSRVHGVDWLAVFTRVDQYSAYLHARDQEVGDYQAPPGRLVVDELLPRLGDQVGLVINPAGHTPFTFPADAIRACDD
ncbi:SseB family protein [Millisia brevis]|uniref:SseB family protein n=1 Tax=Millisia brevis TaxID=264148 RepID=UPI001470E0A5|nr:SseB family protein [Millisia brevis]